MFVQSLRLGQPWQPGLVVIVHVNGRDGYGLLTIGVILERTADLGSLVRADCTPFTDLIPNVEAEDDGYDQTDGPVEVNGADVDVGFLRGIHCWERVWVECLLSGFAHKGQYHGLWGISNK